MTEAELRDHVHDPKRMLAHDGYVRTLLALLDEARALAWRGWESRDLADRWIACASQDAADTLERAELQRLAAQELFRLIRVAAGCERPIDVGALPYFVQRLREQKEEAEASLPWIANRTQNDVDQVLGEVRRLRVNPEQEFPQTGYVEVTRAKEALRNAYADVNALRDKVEQLQQDLTAERARMKQELRYRIDKAQALQREAEQERDELEARALAAEQERDSLHHAIALTREMQASVEKSVAEHLEAGRPVHGWIAGRLCETRVIVSQDTQSQERENVVEGGITPPRDGVLTDEGSAKE